MTIEKIAVPPHPDGPWDPVINQLRALRHAAGDPSYADLARRIGEQRMAAGADEHAARIARSTVHDCFRLGRTRINLTLVRELVQALDSDPAGVDRWVAGASGSPATPDTTETAETPEAPEAPEAPEVPEDGPSARPGWRQIVALTALCLGINFAGAGLKDIVGTATSLELVGTLVLAVALGPWRAVALGIVTNLVGVLGDGWVSLPYALVTVVGALLWGYGVRRWGLGLSLPRFFSLSLIVTLAGALVAAAVVVTFGPSVNEGLHLVTHLLEPTFGEGITCLAVASLLINLGDQLTCAFAALVVLALLPGAFRTCVPFLEPARRPSAV